MTVNGINGYNNNYKPAFGMVRFDRAGRYADVIESVLPRLDELTGEKHLATIKYGNVTISAASRPNGTAAKVSAQGVKPAGVSTKPSSAGTHKPAKGSVFLVSFESYKGLLKNVVDFAKGTMQQSVSRSGEVINPKNLQVEGEKLVKLVRRAKGDYSDYLLSTMFPLKDVRKTVSQVISLLKKDNEQLDFVEKMSKDAVLKGKMEVLAASISADKQNRTFIEQLFAAKDSKEAFVKLQEAAKKDPKKAALWRQIAALDPKPKVKPSVSQPATRAVKANVKFLLPGPGQTSIDVWG